MQDLILRLEDACLSLNGATLFVPGLIATAAGLFLWLGGMRYAGIVIGLLGATAGAALGLFCSHWLSLKPVVAVLAGAVVLALIALILKQMVIFLLAVIIFAATGGLTYMAYSLDSPYLQDKLARLRRQTEDPAAEPPAPGSPEAEYLRRIAALNQAEQSDHAPQANQAGAETPSDSALHARAVAQLKAILAELRLHASSNWGRLVLWIVVGGLVGLAVAWWLKHIVMALSCSIVGSAAVFGGVLALLLSKKAAVLSALHDRPRVGPVLFAGMVLFGWVVQLFLTRPAARKAAEKEDEDDE